jgi:hypothetical protein
MQQGRVEHIFTQREADIKDIESQMLRKKKRKIPKKRECSHISPSQDTDEDSSLQKPSEELTKT